MATIRRKSAVVDFGKFRLSGFIAWLRWGLVQVYWSFFRNRGRRDNGLAPVRYDG
jgi:NADH dehydrogenase